MVLDCNNIKVVPLIWEIPPQAAKALSELVTPILDHSVMLLGHLQRHLPHCGTADLVGKVHVLWIYWEFIHEERHF